MTTSLASSFLVATTVSTSWWGNIRRMCLWLRSLEMGRVLEQGWLLLMIVVIWVIIICSRVKHLWISKARVALVTLSFKLLLLRLEDAERICWIRSKASIDIYVNVDIRFISSHWLRWSIGIEILLLLNIDFLLFKSCLRLTLIFWWATGGFSIVGALNC